jgi:hypothetical protein
MTRPSWFWRFGEALDQFLNVALLNGEVGETISMHAALSEIYRHRWACCLCCWLSRTVERNHCQKVLLGHSLSERGGLSAGLQLFAIFLLLTGALWRLVFHLRWLFLPVLLFGANLAQAQSSPGWTRGYVPGVQEWNGLWGSKLDQNNPVMNGTMQGPSAVLTGPGLYGKGVGLPGPYGILAWWRADDATSDVNCTTPATNMGVVGCIPDHAFALGWTVTPHNATQSTVGAQPGFIANTGNGLPAINFNGTSQYLNFNLATEPYTLFIVYNTTIPLPVPAAGNTFYGLIGGDASNGANGYGAYEAFALTGLEAVKSWGRYRQFVRTVTSDGSGNPFTWDYAANTQPITGLWDVFGIRNTGSGLRTYHGIYPEGPQMNLSDNFTPSTLNGAGLIGAAFYNHVPQWFFNGQIKEILLFGALTDQQYGHAAEYLDARHDRKFPAGRDVYTAFQANNETAPITTSSNENLLMLTRLDNLNFAYKPSHLVPYYNSNNATFPYHGLRDPQTWLYKGACYTTFTPAVWWGQGSTEVGVDIYQSDGDCRANPNPQFNYCTTIYTGGTANAWSPSPFVDSDGSTHIFFSMVDGSSHRQIYEVHPNVPDNFCGVGAWSTPIELTGTSLPTSMLDQWMFKIGATYYLWYANQSSGPSNIEVISSTNLLTGWAALESGNWLNLPATMNGVNVSGNVEAPCPLYRGPSAAISGFNSYWEVLADAKGQGMFSVTSENGMTGTYGSIAAINTEGGPVQHLCPVRVLPNDTVFQQNVSLKTAAPTFACNSNNGTLDQTARDDAAYVTEPSSSTSCSFTFSQPKAIPPHCSLSPISSGALQPVVTPATTSGVSWTHASQSGAQYALTCSP